MQPATDSNVDWLSEIREAIQTELLVAYLKITDYEHCFQTTQTKYKLLSAFCGKLKTETNMETKLPTYKPHQEKCGWMTITTNIILNEFEQT